MTKEIIDRMPENIRETIETWKERYSDSRFDEAVTRGEIRGYLKGLRDTIGLSTVEFRCLYSYMTLSRYDRKGA